MLKGDRQCPEALSMAPVKSHCRLVKRMAFPAFARLKCFHAMLDEDFYHVPYSFV
jgi:hypothetical protein